MSPLLHPWTPSQHQLPQHKLYVRPPVRRFWLAFVDANGGYNVVGSAMVGRMSRSAALLAAECTNVCLLELQQLVETLARPGGAPLFTHSE